MPNLMITTACNLDCGYCFAKGVMGKEQSALKMEWATFISILDWIDRGNVPELTVQLMGGEPTLSVHFFEMVAELNRRSRQVLVFSNGTVPLSDTVCDQSQELGVQWVVNINEPERYSRKQAAALHRNLTRLERCASLNVNFYSPHVSYDFVFEVFGHYNVQPLMKMGMALPIAGGKNQHIRPEDWELMAGVLDRFFKKAEEHNIRLAAECGFPLCHFREHLEKYPTLFENDEISNCGSRLDIAPNGHVFNCLPLSDIASVPYQKFANYSQASKWFHDFLMPYRHLGGIDSDCLVCPDLSLGNCRVCPAHSIAEFSRVPLPEIPGSDDESR